MKKFAILLILPLLFSLVGCAHLRSAAECCKAHATPAAVAMGTHTLWLEDDLFAGAEISAKQELAALLRMDLSEQQQETLAETWSAVHRLEAENRSKLMEQGAALDELKGAEKLDVGKIESRYAQVAALHQEAVKANAQAINQMREALTGEQRSQARMQLRSGGDLPMMGKVLWCIDFCSGQADALCYGGGDLKCWRKQFIKCAAICYR